MTAIAPPSPADRLRLARRQWLDTGAVADGLLPPALQERWARSQRHGLRPDARVPGAPHASAAQLTRALDHRRTHPDTPSHATRQTPPPPPGATPSPAHTPHAHQGGDGDWGALPPQAQDMARVAHTGGWSPKKA